MIRALAIKELRETAWIAAIGLAAYLLVVGMAVSPSLERSVISVPGLNIFAQIFFGAGTGQEFPFLGSGFVSAFGWISVVLVLALGYRQSLGESLGNTYGFLLHRPVDRTTVLVSKMLVGLSLFLAFAAVPVLLYAWWAATPGTHPSPFEWSMMSFTWKLWIAMPVLYLGAFTSGIRPGRWRGTRLLPLVAAVVAWLLAVFLPLWPVSGLPILILATVLFVASILWIGETRDFS